ncbi:MAG: SGNH/GDSL hydrolase family protein [Candidatus Hydrogenedentes bacterium]|nr:SGNH/GDSL hydrolase family protein [Candidatus Hydrogenedentota bacterium]
MDTPAHPRTRARKAARRLLSAAVIALTTLILLEAALRALGLARPVLYEADPDAGFRLKPDQCVRYLGNTIEINRWGVRDPRPLATKRDGVRRILVLGDSVTWGGIRLRQEHLFTSVIEGRLDGVEVVNAGVNGYSPTQMVALFRRHLRGLEPDLVLVYTIPGDFTRPPVVRLTGNSLAYPLRRPRLALGAACGLVRMMAYRRLGWDWLETGPVAEPVESLAEAERVARNTDALTALAAELRGKAGLLVVVSPTPPSPLNRPLPAGVAEALEQGGIRWIDLGAQVAPAPELFVDHVHLAAAGHARVAEALAPILAGEGQPAPAARPVGADGPTGGEQE